MKRQQDPRPTVAEQIGQMLLKMMFACGDIKLRGAQHQKIKESASFTIAGAINRLYFRLQVDTGGALNRSSPSRNISQPQDLTGALVGGGHPPTPAQMDLSYLDPCPPPEPRIG